MADVVLQNVINTVQVQNETGENSKELPIGALASNVAFGGLQSTESVQVKLENYDDFIKNLSTDNVKYTKNEVTQTLTEYLEKNITTDNKSTGIEEQEENDDYAYVTAKGVIDYLASKTNTEIKSTTEVANSNLVTDNAVYQYMQANLPVAAETLDEAENAKYITVELFNSKYISMFEGDLTDDTTDITTLVNPSQVVTYVKSKIETGEIEENSAKLVTSGTLYTKFLDTPSLLRDSLFAEGFQSTDKIYVNPFQVVSYVNSKVPNEAVVLSDNSDVSGYYVSPALTAEYMLSKYVGTIEEIETQVETEEVDEEGNVVTELIIVKKIVHTPLKDIIPEDESTLDINDIYFKGFVTPKQVVDYVALQNHNVDTALRKYIGITGTVAETGNLLPEMGEGVTILSRLAALEEALKINTTTTN